MVRADTDVLVACFWQFLAEEIVFDVLLVAESSKQANT